MKKHPLISSLLLVTTEVVASDAFTQFYIEKKGSYDYFRGKSFAIFGFTVHGCIDYWLYNKFLWRLFPKKSVLSTISKICAYEFLFVPLIYFPIFYYVCQSVFDHNWSQHSFAKGIQRYGKNFKQDLPAGWIFWLPLTTIAFTILPLHLRLPVLSIADMIWVSGLGYFRGDLSKNSNSIQQELNDMLS